MTTLFRHFITVSICLCAMLHFENGYATQQASEDQKAKAIQSAFQASEKTATIGPKRVELKDQGSLFIPDHYVFIPQKEAITIMNALGNSAGPELIGLVLPNTAEMPWVVTVRYIDSGYLKDGDAKNWSSDSLLKSLKAGTEEQNKTRVEKGFEPIQVQGWIEEPKYDSQSHKLIWSMAISTKSTKSDPTVNYNTYVLGREGYFQLDLITASSTIEKDKAIAKKLLANLKFAEGKRYQDFNAKTDKVAEYGIAALVTGIVAKKLGLFAMAGLLILKLWKALMILPVLLWGRIKKLLGYGDSTAEK